jgi:hypothetical protein
MQNRELSTRWEQLQIAGGPPKAECITLRAYGPLAVGKSRLLIDIMDALNEHPRWKNRIFLLDTEGNDANPSGT